MPLPVSSAPLPVELPLAPVLQRAELLAAWRPAMLGLGVGTLLLGLLFRAEVMAALRIWDSSTAYNHCWLVLPVALWLLWQRRGRLAVLTPAPRAGLALLAIPPALLWLVAERLGVMEGRQFALLGLFYALVLALLGWRLLRALAAPLSYLIFLVPFGAFSVPWLQAVTAWMIDVGLNLTGIPHYVDALIIEVPSGAFYVAEACAGLRFAIAALAFGALYAFTMFRSPWRRLAVMGFAVAVPVLANGARALGLVILGEWQGSAAAIATDHVLYGWLFFSLVMLLLILAGLPFRQDGAPPVPAAPVPPRMTPRRRMAAASLVGAGGALLIAGAAVAAGTALDRQGTGVAQAQPAALQPLPGCEAEADGALRCGSARLLARLVVFPAAANWDGVAAARRRAIGSNSDEDVTFAIPIGGGGNWGARLPHDSTPGQPSALAAAVWLDGQPAGDGLRSRATQALRRIRGNPPGAPVMVVVELQAEGGSDSARDRTLLREVLEAQANGLPARAAALSRGG